MLLYAATDEDIQPDVTYRMSGNRIGAMTARPGSPLRGDSRAVGWDRRHAYWSVNSGFVKERTWAASGSMGVTVMVFFEASSSALTDRALARRRLSIDDTVLL